MSRWTGLLFALFLTAPMDVALAASKPQSPKAVMEHHIVFVKKDDVEEIVKDYARDAVMVMPAGTFIGIDDVRKFFVALAAQRRDWSTFDVTQEVKEHGVVLQRVVKTGAVEVFVVRNGKIVFQATQATAR